jgi:hypothetical protein
VFILLVIFNGGEIMLKKVLLSAFTLILIFSLLTACGGPKTSLTETEFINLVEKADYYIVEESDEFGEFDKSGRFDTAVSSVFAAESGGNFIIEFYTFSSVEEAEAAYEEIREELDKLLVGSYAGSNYSIANYSLFNYTINEKYYHNFRIDNTFVCVETDKINKDAVIKIMDTLGYK